jgi:hypothetical protein
MGQAGVEEPPGEQPRDPILLDWLASQPALRHACAARGQSHHPHRRAAQ